MSEPFLERTKLLIGEEGIQKLTSAKVLIFGVGGVGGHVCEGLVRAGVSELHLVDHDIISESNINRQIIANRDTVGQSKVQVMHKRIQSINPKCKVVEMHLFYLPDEKATQDFDFSAYDYVVDAIDTVAAKIDIIARCKEAKTPVISSMGTGNKLDPSKFQIADISKTNVCPLAKVVRKELRDRSIKGVDVLFSTEEPIKTGVRTPGSISYTPAVAGLLIAGHVIRNLLK